MYNLLTNKITETTTAYLTYIALFANFEKSDYHQLYPYYGVQLKIAIMIKKAWSNLCILEEERILFSVRS